MFENSYKICASKDYGNLPTTYFCDLNIIYPLKRAVLNLIADGECVIYAGSEKAQVQQDEATGLITCDITNLVAESDFLYISVKGTEKNWIVAQIDLEFAGGLKSSKVSDNSWKCKGLSIDNDKMSAYQLWSECTDDVETVVG